jgi:hypothetical protein
MTAVRDSRLRRTIALFVCLAVAQSLLALALLPQDYPGAARASMGGMAGPVKAAGHLLDRQELALEGAKTRNFSSALLLPAAIRHSASQLHSEPLETADQPRQPQSALLRVRFGRAPPLHG